MHESADRYPGVVTIDADLERELEARIRETSGLVVRVAYSVLRRREDAEDVAQEAFARAYRRISQLRDRDRFRAWLLRMTWRIAIDRWRSDRRRLVRDYAAVDSAPAASAEAVAVDGERAARLWQAIDQLPDKLRLAIVLSAIEGYDVREVSRLLQLPEGTVKSRLFLARKELARSLQCLANDTRPT